MDRTTYRIFLGSLGFATISATLFACFPRVTAWVQDYKRMTVASSRADTCLVTDQTLVANNMITSHDGRRLPDGTYICDWSGNTAQVSNGGFIGYMQAGKVEDISEKLKKRGHKP